MLTLEKVSEVDVRSCLGAQLVVRSTDISFESLGSETVTIRVLVHNEGEHQSKPTIMGLESAPFGAFVRWQPLAVMSIPPIEPGESRELSIDVARPHPEPLGGFDRTPPSAVLTAVSSPDEPAPRKSGLVAMAEMLRKRNTLRRTGTGLAAAFGTLPPDLLELMGRGQTHWAGNLNVFIGNHAVERHLAKALRVYPGRTNLAMFVVGDHGRADAYAFDIVGANPDWQAALFDLTHAKTLDIGGADKLIDETQWVEANGCMLVMLAALPPEDCQDGNIEIHVTRRSTQSTAVVEFNLDPNGQGTGCYFA